MEFKKCLCYGYRHVFFDLDDPTIDQNSLIDKVNKMIIEYNKEVTIIAVTLRETITAEAICRKLNINFIQRPP